MSRRAWIALLLVVVVAVALVAVPVALLWPWRAQTPSHIWWAWTLRRQWAPIATPVLAAFVAGGLYWGWPKTRWIGRTALVLLLVVGLGAAWFAHQNHFEWMFTPIPSPAFDRGATAPAVDADDLVLGVVVKDDAVAFPVRRIGYHHLVNLDAGGEPIVATYCTLCHTGLVWRRTVNGVVLTFRLIGINNQNMLMEDLESRSWWQQSSGEAIAGPLKGQRLTPLEHDEVTFALWVREHPETRVLARVDPELDIRKGWEDRMLDVPTVVPAPVNDPLHRRALVVGIVVDGQAKAYPRDQLTPKDLRGPGKPPMTYAVMDRVRAVPIAVLVGGDGISIRVFDRRVDGHEIELVARPGSSPARFVDAGTGSEWDISGTAVAGTLAGRQLARVHSISEFWFDWLARHPGSQVHKQWTPRTGV